MTLQQSPEIQRLKSLQGGSSSSAPSFIRSEHNQNSSLSSATDLGTVTNLTRVFTGDIGSETGRNTLFYKVETTDPSDVRIFKNFVNSRTDKDIAVGLLDTNRHQIILDSQGFGQINEVHNTPELESLRKLPKGVYYFTVASSQWQSAPFSITLQVIRSRELFGSAGGAASPTLRLALVKLFGTAGGDGSPEATITPISAELRPELCRYLTVSQVPHPVHHPIALRLQLQLRVAVTNLGGISYCWSCQNRYVDTAAAWRFRSILLLKS